jgi:acyl-CoA synthetase (AMP-forming)/AMP-acid ligase II
VPLSIIGPGDWPTLAAHAAPHSAALLTADGEVVSYADLEVRASRLADALRRRGVVKGERLAILDTDGVEYVLLIVAAMKLGVILAPLNFRLAAAELAELVSVIDPTVIAVGPRYAPLLDDLARAAPSLRLTVATITDPAGVATARVSVADLISESDVTSLAASTLDTDVVTWLLTSGTTGRPRIVAQSQGMVKADIAKGAVEHGFRPDECLYAGSPLFHVAGMGWLSYALARGACYLLIPQFDVDELLAHLKSGVLTRCLLISSMAISLVEHPEVEGDYPALRGIAYGGAATPPWVVRRLQEIFDCDLYNTFGAGTECGGQTVLRPEDHRRALAGAEHLLASIGRPMYGVDLELRAPDGRPVPDGEVGEICTRSDSVMDGYVGQPELTAARVRDGWVHGGDMAWRDSEGYLYLAGRKDDMILRGGENIYPVEVENALSAHPAVSEAVVVGLPDPYWGQIVAAAVLTAPGATIDEDDLRGFAAQRLAHYKLPTRITVLDEFPRNATGKAQRSAILATLAEQPTR